MEETPDYPVTAFVSREGYFKKITPQSLGPPASSGSRRRQPVLLPGRPPTGEILVFTDRFQCYKARLSDFDDGKASQLGDYLPTKLAMEPGRM